MQSRWLNGLTVALLGFWALGTRPASSAEPQNSTTTPPPVAVAPAPRKPHQVVEKGLDFLQTDAVKWRTERGCATCHHGTMTVWALSEAKSQGYAVSAEILWDNTQWTKDQFVSRFSKPRDDRPGWSLVSVPAIYLGMMSQSLPVLSRDEVNIVAVHLARHQEEDGAWLLPPPANGAPPTWESRETLALLAMLAWESYVPTDPEQEADVRARREKAATWLRETKGTGTTQSLALRLLLSVRLGKSAQERQGELDLLLGRQNADGGWSQADGLASDAYATGQTLWVLSQAGVPQDRAEISRAVAFLAASQREDGSWPMTSRNHPGVETTRNPIRNPVPITYFGSAWATLGLVRSVPPELALAVRQQQAFDVIRTLSGVVTKDENIADKPVVRIEIRYELSDEELTKLAGRLTAFPQLNDLRFKSAKITDEGVAQLRRLTQLHSLSLENTAITDAGLTPLKELTSLETLNLKGTKVTDAGILELQKALPQVKLER